MNTTQIKYFLEAARTLNFTEAAKRLYISQPALSKQITAMEGELNMMLFIREKKSVRLTPAGLVLLKELPQFENNYHEIIRKAKIANEGNEGALNVGILEGQMLGQDLTKLFADFTMLYPNISVRLVRDSFSGLRKKLEDQEIDIAFSLDFDIKGHPGISYKIIKKSPAIAVVARNHEIAKKHITSLSDLNGVTLIAVEEKDCPASARMIEEDCKKIGMHPELRFANSLATAMLWIEAGLGVGFVNEMNNLVNNPDVVMLNELKLNDTYMVVAWNEDNINPTVALLREHLEHPDPENQ